MEHGHQSVHLHLVVARVAACVSARSAPRVVARACARSGSRVVGRVAARVSARSALSGGLVAVSNLRRFGTREFLIAAEAEAGKTISFYSHIGLTRSKLKTQVENLLIDTNADFPQDVIGDVGIGPTYFVGGRGHVLRGRGNIAVKENTNHRINIPFQANMVLPKFRSPLIPLVIVTG